MKKENTEAHISRDHAFADEIHQVHDIRYRQRRPPSLSQHLLLHRFKPQTNNNLSNRTYVMDVLEQLAQTVTPRRHAAEAFYWDTRWSYLREVEIDGLR